MVHQISPGIWALLPLGFKVLHAVHEIIYDEMERAGVLNVQMPVLQPRELWEKTGRWQKYIETKTMFTTNEYHYEAEYGLAPTAEEVMCAVASVHTQSWRDLPYALHQIGLKFRDEIRPRLGLLRGREFYMSDAYSFDRDEDGMKESFEKFKTIYEKIFDRVGIARRIAVQADSGTIGGKGSVEYMALNEEVGEDTLFACEVCGYGANLELGERKAGDACPECKHGALKMLHGIEIGHVFQLQKTYSEPMNVVYRDEQDKEQPVWMGCYGIGTSRLVQAIVDQNNDKDGIVWPDEIAPWKVHIVPVKWSDVAQRGVAEELLEVLSANGVSSMLDDREESAGVKFKDADLLGAPWRITVGRRAGERVVELKNRRTGEVKEIGVDDIVNAI